MFHVRHSAALTTTDVYFACFPSNAGWFPSPRIGRNHDAVIGGVLLYDFCASGVMAYWVDKSSASVPFPLSPLHVTPSRLDVGIRRSCVQSSGDEWLTFPNDRANSGPIGWMLGEIAKKKRLRVTRLEMTKAIST